MTSPKGDTPAKIAASLTHNERNMFAWSPTTQIVGNYPALYRLHKAGLCDCPRSGRAIDRVTQTSLGAAVAAELESDNAK